MERRHVWAVHLGAGDQEDVAGFLSVTGEAIRFETTALEEDGTERVISTDDIPFAAIRRARRILGSPVLVVHHAAGETEERIAFYFVRPPPLDRTLGRPVPEAPAPAFPQPRFGFPRTERRERRQAAAYLGVMNRELKSTIRGWQRAIEDGVQRARNRPTGSGGAEGPGGAGPEG